MGEAGLSWATGELGGGLSTQGDCSLMNLDCLGSRKEVSVAELGQDVLEDLGSHPKGHWKPPGALSGRRTGFPGVQGEWAVVRVLRAPQS